MTRRRVRGRTVTLQHVGSGQGFRVLPPQRASFTPAERLAQTGELGEDVVPLLAAANYFERMGMLAGLRGRLARSSLCPEGGDNGQSRDIPRTVLARLQEAIGPEGYGILIDGCVWHRSIAPARLELFRTALYAVAQWRKVHDKPPHQTGVA